MLNETSEFSILDSPYVHKWRFETPACRLVTTLIDTYRHDGVSFRDQIFGNSGVSIPLGGQPSENSGDDGVMPFVCSGVRIALRLCPLDAGRHRPKNCSEVASGEALVQPLNQRLVVFDLTQLKSSRIVQPIAINRLAHA